MSRTPRGVASSDGPRAVTELLGEGINEGGRSHKNYAKIDWYHGLKV